MAILGGADGGRSMVRPRGCAAGAPHPPHRGRQPLHPRPAAGRRRAGAPALAGPDAPAARRRPGGALLAPQALPTSPAPAASGGERRLGCPAPCAQVGKSLKVGGWVKTGREAGAGAFAFLEVNDGSCFESLQVRRRAAARGGCGGRGCRRPEAPLRGRDPRGGGTPAGWPPA